MKDQKNKFYIFLNSIQQKLNTKKINGKWHAQIPFAEVVDGSSLLGIYGEGNSRDSAIANYIEQICGKQIKIKSREYYNVPADL